MSDAREALVALILERFRAAETYMDLPRQAGLLADAILAMLPGRAEAEVKAEALREVAQWLAATNYPTDWHTDARVPNALWEAFVDVVHEDDDGRWHGRKLTREDVADWMAEEAGRIARGEGS